MNAPRIALPVQPNTCEADRERVAANVTRLIELHRLSFGEASRLTGISKTGLYKIADGTSDPCLSSLGKIANTFGVSIASLVAEPRP
jgi:transcriptional regulator with XRE-family HTH domain